MMGMHRKMHGNWFNEIDLYKDTIIFVGLDMELITSADRNDTQHAIMMGIILALIGFTGFVLVFIVHRYSQARSSLSRIQVFSDNLVENMPIGLIATDMNSRVISINPAASAILDTSQELNLQDIDNVLPGEIRHLLEIIPGEKGLIRNNFV